MKNHASFRLAGLFVPAFCAVFGSFARAAETYVLAVYETPAELAARTDPAQAPAYWERFAGFGRELQQAGLIRGGSAFAAGSAQVATAAGTTAPAATPGPQLSGYFVIETASLDEALKWARRAPNVARGGTVAVFPCVKNPGMN